MKIELGGDPGTKQQPSRNYKMIFKSGMNLEEDKEEDKTLANKQVMIRNPCSFIRMFMI